MICCTNSGILYDSVDAKALSSRLQENIAYASAMASSNLAGERGKYPNYEGSSWSKGLLPVDTYCELMRLRGGEGVAATLRRSIGRRYVKK